MNKKVVAVLFGGKSTEHEISKRSFATFVTHMSDEKYTIVPIYITTEGKWLLYDGPLESILTAPLERFGTSVVISPDTEHKGLLRIVNGRVKFIHIDIVLPVLHGLNGEDGTIQGLLELSGLPFVGCGTLSSALCMDKLMTKLIVSTLGISQAEFLAFSDADLTDMAAVVKSVRYKLGYPVFVKPANSGSSIGISKAVNKKELEEALALALKYDRKILVEKAVIGREFECAVLGDYAAPAASCVGEILLDEGFYDFDGKYNNPDSVTVIPAELSEEVSNEIRDIAVKVFKALDCYGLARVDFFFEEKTGKVLFNEINTMPGFTSISMYHMLWQHMGLPLEDLIDKLIELGIKRNGGLNG